MSYYISAKLTQAEPCTADEFNKAVRPLHYSGECRDGYRVLYRDGYVSWCPKDEFERSNLRVDDNKNLPSGVSVGPDMVDKFIAKIYTSTIGDKTTLVRAVLVNGFEIIESSACVDPSNYNEEIGERVCMNKIRDKVWYLLGFLLQTAQNGTNRR